MVSVHFGYTKGANFNPDGRFDTSYKDEWFDDPIVQQMVRDIDNSEVRSVHSIYSPVLGLIAPYYLSGGVKACIMLYKDENYYPDLSVCGDNCEKWLSWIFQQRDVVKVAMYSYDLKFDGYPIEGICENDGSEIKSSKDWCDKMFWFVGGIGDEGEV